MAKKLVLELGLASFGRLCVVVECCDWILLRPQFARVVTGTNGVVEWATVGCVSGGGGFTHLVTEVKCFVCWTLASNPSYCDSHAYPSVAACGGKTKTVAYM